MEYTTSKSHVFPKLLYVYVIVILRTCYAYSLNVHIISTLLPEKGCTFQMSPVSQNNNFKVNDYVYEKNRALNNDKILANWGT